MGGVLSVELLVEATVFVVAIGVVLGLSTGVVRDALAEGVVEAELQSLAEAAVDLHLQTVPGGVGIVAEQAGVVELGIAAEEVDGQSRLLQVFAACA